MHTEDLLKLLKCSYNKTNTNKNKDKIRKKRKEVEDRKVSKKEEKNIPGTKK